MKLTSSKVFTREWDEATGEEVPTNHFLPGAPEAGTFTFDREPTGRLDIQDNPMSEPVVRFNGEPLAQRYTVHSPTGFEWGYGGSGPADLALNILGLFLPAPEAWHLHHDFKWHYIGRLPLSGGRLEAAEVRRWIASTWAREEGR